jgi:hypothetical protein
MSKDLKVDIDFDEFLNIKKKYKKIKKYMRSSIFQIKTMDGNESIVKNLLGENK